MPSSNHFVLCQRYIGFEYFSGTNVVGWPLLNNRFTNDIGYVPYVVTTISFPFMDLTYRIRLLTGLSITQATRRVSHVEQDLLTLPEHLRSPLVFGGVLVAYSLVFYVVSCVLLLVCLSFSFLAMALSVYFRFIKKIDCPFGIFCLPLSGNNISWYSL